MIFSAMTLFCCFYCFWSSMVWFGVGVYIVQLTLVTRTFDVTFVALYADIAIPELYISLPLDSFRELVSFTNSLSLALSRKPTSDEEIELRYCHSILHLWYRTFMSMLNDNASLFSMIYLSSEAYYDRGFVGFHSVYVKGG